MMRAALFGVCLLLLIGAAPAHAADTPEMRLQVAEKLFDLPAYRVIASRQVYEAVGTLPEEQANVARDALADPRVVQVLRGVIVRSMAQTFTLAELEYLTRFLSADEARSTVEKTDAFQAALLHELIAAAMTSPELQRLLLPPQ